MSIHTGLSLFLDPHLEQRIAQDGDVGFGRRSSLAYYRWCLSGSPQMQGTHVEPGISQFRRLWATSIATIISTTMRKPDLSHSPLVMFVSVGFGRRSFLCDVARKLQRAAQGLCYSMSI